MSSDVGNLNAAAGAGEGSALAEPSPTRSGGEAVGNPRRNPRFGAVPGVADDVRRQSIDHGLNTIRPLREWRPSGRNRFDLRKLWKIQENPRRKRIFPALSITSSVTEKWRTRQNRCCPVFGRTPRGKRIPTAGTVHREDSCDIFSCGGKPLFSDSGE